MIPVVKDSIADEYYSNLTKIKRETISLPDEVRARIYDIGRNFNFLRSIKFEEQLDAILVYFKDMFSERRFCLWAEAHIKHYKLVWEFSILEKEVQTNDTKEEPQYYENGIVQL